MTDLHPHARVHEDATSAARRVAILAPMRAELRPLVRPLSLRRMGSGDPGLFSGALGRVEIVAAITGIGTRRAARAAERILDAGPVHHLVVVGIAGGIGPSVAIGDLVVPERVVDLATGTEHRPALLGDATPRGTLATSDGLLADPNEAAALAQRGIVAVDMETAAIAAVCERRKCPWWVFRGISDRADDGTTDAAVFGLAAPDGGTNAAAVARFVVTQPWRVLQLVRLGRGLNRAARVAAEAAIHEIANV